MTGSGQTIGDLLPARTPLERKLVAEISRLRAVLVWYGNPAAYKEDDWGVLSVNCREYGNPGQRARQTVKTLDRRMR